MRGYLIICIISCVLVLGCATTKSPMIITDEEAKVAIAPDDSTYGFASSETLQASGPRIIIKSPDPSTEQQAPVDVNVVFVPREGTKVDLNMLKLEFLGTIFTHDITERVIKYASDQGIMARKADFPSGHFTLRLTIGDNEGGVTQQMFYVRVK